MDIFNNLIIGFRRRGLADQMLYCLIGSRSAPCLGIGHVATIAMPASPLTFTAPVSAPDHAVRRIYYGAQYGGSTTAILVNLPGESSSVVTCLDGYQMARQGAPDRRLLRRRSARSRRLRGPTLIRRRSRRRRSPSSRSSSARRKYFSLMVLGLVAAVVLAHGSLVKGDRHGGLRPAAGTDRTDVNSGVLRFTFDVPELSDGIGFRRGWRWACSAPPRSSANSPSRARRARSSPPRSAA